MRLKSVTLTNPYAMKKTILLISVILLSGNIIFSQEATPLRKHEIGLTFSSLNSFGLVYKTGRKSTLFRLGMLALNLDNIHGYGREQDSLDRKSSGYGIGLKAGFEKRIMMVKNLDFVIGLDAGCNYNHSKSKEEGRYYTTTNTIWSVTSALYCVIGAAYTVKERLVISAEIYPAISYIYGKSKSETYQPDMEVTTSRIAFGFTNTAASLTFAYRFGK